MRLNRAKKKRKARVFTDSYLYFLKLMYKYPAIKNVTIDFWKSLKEYT